MSRDVIVTHPSNMKVLRLLFPPAAGSPVSMFGVSVFAVPWMPPFALPGDRFVEYEDSDLDWLVPLGRVIPAVRLVPYEALLNVPASLWDVANCNYASARVAEERYCGIG